MTPNFNYKCLSRIQEVIYTWGVALNLIYLLANRNCLLVLPRDKMSATLGEKNSRQRTNDNSQEMNIIHNNLSIVLNSLLTFEQKLIAYLKDRLR